MPVTGPDKCPECGHEPLVPVSPGVCPECGFQYDEHTLIWRPKRPWRIYLLFANTLIFLPWLFRFLQVVVLLRQWPTTPVVLGALASAITLGWSLPRLRVLLSEGHRFVALTPRGIQARTPKDHYLVPWDELGEVTVLFGVPQLKRRTATTTCTLDWIFDTDREVEDFAKHATHAKERYDDSGPRRAAETAPNPRTPRQFQ
jgi:hypothetical protein